MNSTSLWSNSLTKDFLTEYAEGLACKNFDNRIFYESRRIDVNTWLVMSKKSMLRNEQNMQHGIVFQRVRKVIIDVEGFMSCSCGYVQRMMMPCCHICSIIDNSLLYVPSMFHIRWHKSYYYYYRHLIPNL